MYGWMNILSIVFGILAWTIPALALRGKKNRPGLSFALCSLSLAFQVFCTQHLVAIRDWAAIEDTHGAVAFASAVLLAVTVVLNIIARKK